MNSLNRVLIFSILLLFGALFRGNSQSNSDPGGVLSQLTIAKFSGSGTTEITAMATGPDGSIYVAGTTTAPDLPVKNAAQARFGESRIMRTGDHGTSWVKVGDPAGEVTTFAADPVDPKVLFAAGPAGIYRSLDAGNTWNMVWALAGGPPSMAIDPANHLRVAVAAGGQLLRSFDGGGTWNAIPQSAGSRLLAGPGALLADNMNLSLDWGKTWTALQPPVASLPFAAAFDPSRTGWIYVSTGYGSSGALWLTMDAGRSWVQKTAPSTDVISFLAVDPDRPSGILAITRSGLYRSTDGAASWVRQSSISQSGQAPQYVAGRSACGGGIFEAGGGGVGYSADYYDFVAAPVSKVRQVFAGQGCSAYVLRDYSTDVFVARLAPDGATLWTTFLGGADEDAPVGIAVDPSGSVWVAGNTSSLDFPVTQTPMGITQLSTAAFISSFTSDGTVAGSVTIRGSTASALAVDALGSGYLAGNALVIRSFAAKFALDATLVYLRPLNQTQTLQALAVNAQGEAIGAMHDRQSLSLIQVSADGSQVKSATIPEVVLPVYAVPVSMKPSLTIDGNGDVYVADLTTSTASGVTPGAYVSPLRTTGCPQGFFDARPYGNLFVTKLRGADWQPVYSSVLAGPCGVTPGSLVVDSTGSATVGMTADAGLELLHPRIAGPACGSRTGAYARLSADGSTLLAASYLDFCEAPSIAIGGDGALLASTPSAAILKLDWTVSSSREVERIENAFSGDASGVARGGLYSITLSGFYATLADLGMNFGGSLPAELSGVRVLFDGVPGGILRTEPDRVLVVAPGELAGEGYTQVQVSFQGVSGPAVAMPLARAQLGLLTLGFPDPVTGPADGNVHNEDGTLNSASNPAARGSSVTLFANVIAGGSVFSSWNSGSQPENVLPLPGFISALVQIPVRVPADLAGGKVTVAIRSWVQGQGLVSNGVYVYVQEP